MKYLANISSSPGKKRRQRLQLR